MRCGGGWRRIRPAPSPAAPNRASRPPRRRPRGPGSRDTRRAGRPARASPDRASAARAPAGPDSATASAPRWRRVPTARSCWRRSTGRRFPAREARDNIRPARACRRRWHAGHGFAKLIVAFGHAALVAIYYRLKIVSDYCQMQGTGVVQLDGTGPLPTRPPIEYTAVGWPGGGAGRCRFSEAESDSDAL